ncbi:MAG: hypothetical protein EOO04_26220 [Chitinophagaceae bacterium]|nr:MAG: hypothetical protein EOO04_26220 [Chitinophagaceae bacterium]
MWTNKKLRTFLFRTSWICVGIPLLSLQLRCQDGNGKTNAGLKGLKFQSLAPLQLHEGKILPFEKLLYIYESADEIAVLYPVYHQKSRITLNSEGDLIADELEEFSARYKCVLYGRGDSLGRYYDSLADRNPSFINIDSFLTVNGVFNTEKLFYRIRDSLDLVRSSWNDEGSELTELYVPAPEAKLRISDSIVLVFSKQLEDYQFSLPGSHLRTKDLKISRLQLIMNPQATGREELHYRRELSFELTVTTEFMKEVEVLLQDFRGKKSEGR